MGTGVGGVPGLVTEGGEPFGGFPGGHRSGVGGEHEVRWDPQEGAFSGVPLPSPCWFHPTPSLTASPVMGQARS